MKKTLFSALVILSSAFALSAQQTSPEAVELSKLLNEFLTGASRNDVSIHDRFWADDLIYTRAAGERITKTDLMKSVRSAPARKPDDPVISYSAEETKIRLYGNAAVVAFILVSTREENGLRQVTKFFNTGTFVKRSGRWQVVAWQATAIPSPKAPQ